MASAVGARLKTRPARVFFRTRNAASERQGWLIWSLIALLAWAPLPLGSNRPLPWTLLALAVGLLLTLWTLVAAWRPDRLVLVPPGLRPAAAGLGFVVAIALLQMIPNPPQAWQNPLWFEAAGVLGEPVAGRISIDPESTRVALMKLLTFAGVFWLALQASHGRGGARRIIVALMVLGVGHAGYGMLSYQLAPDQILWWRKWFDMEGATSTFVCRGCYAVYAGLGLLCATGWYVVSGARTAGRHGSGKPAPVAPGWRWWSLRALPPAVIAAALVSSLSRTGVVASLLALASLLVCLARTRVLRPGDSAAAASVLTVLGVLIFVLVGDPLIQRIAGTSLEQQVRFPLYERIWLAAQATPWFGTGYGTFAQGFAPYQGWLAGYWDQAHNTYLEALFELGLPTTVVFFASIGWLAVLCARSLENRSRNALYPALGVAATVLVALDGLLDFGAEVPGVAVTYAAILGVATGRAGRIPGKRGQPGQRARHPRARVCLGLSLGTGIGLLVMSGPLLVAHLEAIPVRLVSWSVSSGQSLSPAALEWAVGAARDGAALGDRAGLLWQRGAMELMLDRDQGGAHAARAEASLRESLALAPANAAGWTALADAIDRQGGDPATVSGALALSVRTAPNQEWLIRPRLTVAVRAWDRLDLRTRSLFADQVILCMRSWPKDLITLARDSDRVDVIRQALARDPNLLAWFDRLNRTLGRS